MNKNIEIRMADEKDIDEFLRLIVRMKRFNGEFDSMFNTTEDKLDKIRIYYLNAIKDRDRFIIFVGTKDKKIISLIKAEIRERIFYNPEQEIRIEDLYIMPEYRRTMLGRNMVDTVIKEGKKRGIGMVSAEFPAMNEIALNFYSKIGFREIVKIFGKCLDDDQ